MSSILRSLGIPYVNPHPSSPDDGPPGSILPLPVLRTVLANNGWVLLPARSSSSSPAAARSDDDLASSSFLGDVLADALDRARELLDSARRSSPTPTAVVDNGAVLFLGMDSPELPMEEVVHGLRVSSGGVGPPPPPPRKNGDDAPDDDGEYGTDGHRGDERETFAGKAHLCPANDGGYGLLSVPKHAPSSAIFSGVRWSQPLAALSQLKALTDCDVNVSIGKLMFDVDEPADVRDLVARLIRHRDREGGGRDDPTPPREGGDSLTMSSSGIDPVSSTGVRMSFPHHTWRMVTDLNVVGKV
ncbi:hypothetical protein ACHAW5_006920 [Stephanodiscus triporus]|uniref:Uncharacterized protein n=1 Tax=Stephanodiscus triporus TaxID=2934178 RepID=A0ABD3NFY1_9STRA